jgi:hypothetical protein
VTFSVLCMQFCDCWLSCGPLCTRCAGVWVTGARVWTSRGRIAHRNIPAGSDRPPGNRPVLTSRVASVLLAIPLGSIAFAGGDSSPACPHVRLLPACTGYPHGGDTVTLQLGRECLHGSGNGLRGVLVVPPFSATGDTWGVENGSNRAATPAFRPPPKVSRIFFGGGLLPPFSLTGDTFQAWDVPCRGVEHSSTRGLA